MIEGKRLGRYEIRAKIGEGGMGEVYLATDTELDRTVAIKILPARLASDQQRLQRFIQEAKAASQWRQALDFSRRSNDLLVAHDRKETAAQTEAVTGFF